MKDNQPLQDNVKKVFIRLDPEIKSDDYFVSSIPSKSQSNCLIEIGRKIMELRRRKTTLKTVECGIEDERRNIYLNEDLPKHTRDLFK